jgi:hypothetical protein
MGQLKNLNNNSIKSKFPEAAKAKGIEKLLLISTNRLIDLNDGIDKLAYGKPKESSAYKTGKSIPKNPLDLGLLPILDIIISINYCDLLDYSISKIPGNSKFNPDPSKMPTDLFGKSKWMLQKAAYEAQMAIDGFYETGRDVASEESKKSLFNLIQNIREEIQSSVAQFNLALTALQVDRTDLANTSNLLMDTFPVLKNATNYLTDAFAFIGKYDDYRQIPNEEYQNILIKIDKVRNYLIIIQGLNTPSALLSTLGNLNGIQDLQRDLSEKIKKLIQPQKALPTLKKILDVCKSIKSIVDMALKFIQLGQLIVRIGTLLIKVFKIIVQFLKALPAPSIFLTAGIQNTLSDTVATIKQNGVGNFTKRLNQASILLEYLFIFAQNVSIIFQEIIQKLVSLINSISACASSSLVDDLNKAVNDLNQQKDSLDRFVKNKENNDKVKGPNNKIGEYTIDIVTEEVVDESFTLRRRYGVALDNRGILVLQSTPTFASDTSIIIREVKQLLTAKGLINQTSSIYTLEEEETIVDATSYLYDDDINWENIDEFDSGLDSPNNEDENDGLGLNAFINKLKGGKKLRAKMRQSMASNRATLGTNLRSSDPTGRYSTSIVGKTDR